ncbi:MAG: DUF445 domain-containing protein [Nitrospinota bacterium]
MDAGTLGGLALWLPPLVGALIGYGTNSLAIWMLFHPYRQVRLLGRPLPFTPGLIPRERRRIAETVAESIERELLSGRELVELLKESALKRHVVRAIDTMVDEKLKPFLLAEAVRYQIKLLLSREVVKQIDAFIEERALHVAESLDIAGAVAAKLDQLDLAELEALVYRVSGKQLRFITASGGVLGFLIGGAQSLLSWWAG